MTPIRPDRLLFPLAAAWAAASVPLWLSGALDRPAAVHGHEMLFGFAFAVIGGFLYTRRHAFWPWGLAAAWLAGRAAQWLPPGWIALLSGIAYPMLLGMLLLPGLWRSAKRPENRIAPALVALLGLLDLLWWLAWLSGEAAFAGRSLSVTLNALALLLLVMGGRALRAALGGHLERQGKARRDRPDRVNELRLAGLLGGALLLEGAGFPGPAALLLAAAGLLGGWRLRGWGLGHAREAVRLWSLAAGYLWVVCGLLVKALWLMELLPGRTGVHALGVGALGTLTLVMMARTALLRARRPLVRLGDVAVGVVLVAGAALARLAADLASEGRMALLWVAAMAWSLAFALLCLRLLCTGARALDPS